MHFRGHNSSADLGYTQTMDTDRGAAGCYGCCGLHHHSRRDRQPDRRQRGTEIGVPDSPWRAGSCRQMVNTAIEDLAGNHPRLPFDVDVFQNVTQHIATTTMPIPFTIP